MWVLLLAWHANINRLCPFQWKDADWAWCKLLWVPLPQVLLPQKSSCNAYSVYWNIFYSHCIENSPNGLVRSSSQRKEDWSEREGSRRMSHSHGRCHAWCDIPASWNPVTVMLLSSEGRKGAALVALLAVKDSNQVPGALPHKSRQILQGFFPCVAFHSSSWELLRVCLGKKPIQLLFSNSCWGRGSMISHWGLMCLFCPFRTVLTTVHICFLFFLFPPISSPVPVYHLWVCFFFTPKYRNK